MLLQIDELGYFREVEMLAVAIAPFQMRGFVSLMGCSTTSIGSD